MTARVSGACHCGAQRFSAPAPEQVTHCQCSTCKKRGTLAAYYPPDAVELDLTPETLADYQWGDRMMTFHHCTVCGCATHAEHGPWSPDGVTTRPGRVILNARLFDDFDLAAVPVVELG